MNEYLEPYFDNILSRTWLGQKKDTSIKIETSELEDIYFEKILNEKIIVVGKTNKFFFILECFNSEGFKYSNGLFNDSLVNLLYGYKDRQNLISTDSIEKFVESMLLNNTLQKTLSVNHTDLKDGASRVLSFS